MEVGNRIVYDQDGEIVSQTGEMKGDVLPRKDITELHFIDLPYGSINYSMHRIVSIAVVTRQPILEEIQVILTPEQQQIIDLENQLLLSSGVI
ncbi:hypothetical protein [Paenibacillus sp. GXUN7292]|uniref:hypothetical protein n=1 Tax=Paenibacillus sp. GXUN7292 TaxID=3422499 RepID=UPI003D7E34EA